MYYESLKSPSTLITAIVESGNPNKCLVSSLSSELVIDSGATDHMTGNSSLVSTFQSQPSTSTVTQAYGSQSCVLGLDINFLTLSFPLSFVLSLPILSFNLMFVSKLTQEIKCYISFFPDFCLFQDLITKQIIGSQSCVLGLDTNFLTLFIPLSFILSLPNLSFNLMYVSKLTQAIKCYIPFFLDLCLFQDLMTKQIIGKGRESGGLYILDPTTLRLVACFGVTTPFETHCRLGHPSLPLLKKP